MVLYWLFNEWLSPTIFSTYGHVKKINKFYRKIFDYGRINADNTHPLCGAIAQLGERNTGSVEVSGSIPLSSTT